MARDPALTRALIGWAAGVAAAFAAYLVIVVQEPDPMPLAAHRSEAVIEAGSQQPCWSPQL